jgi:hypothetical protein
VGAPSETGLYYHGARYYSPWLGRWTAVDPLGVKDGVNPYRYSQDNPVLYSDPSGTTGTAAEEAAQMCLLSEHEGGADSPSTDELKYRKEKGPMSVEPTLAEKISLLQKEREAWSGRAVKLKTPGQAKWTVDVFLESALALDEAKMNPDSASLLTAVAAEEVMFGATKKERSDASPNTAINNIFSLQFDKPEKGPNTGPIPTNANGSPEEYATFGAKWAWGGRGETPGVERQKGVAEKSRGVWNPAFSSTREAVRAQIAVPFSSKGWEGIHELLASSTSTASQLGEKLKKDHYGAHSGPSLAAVHDATVSVLTSFSSAVTKRIREMPANSKERQQLQAASNWLNRQIEIAKTRTR